MTFEQMPRSVRVLIIATAVLGGIAFAVRVPEFARWGVGDVAALALLVALTVAAERFSIPLRHGTETVNFALTDGVWAAGLLLARPGVLTAAVLLGVSIGQLSQRRAWFKVVYNVAQFLIGVTLAEVVLGVLPHSGPADSWTWAAALVAMSMCFFVNACSIVLVVSLAERRPFVQVLVPPLRVNVLHWVGNMVLGILGALTWSVAPTASVLLVAPVALAYTAYREHVDGVRERDDWRRLYEAGRFLTRPLGEEDDFGPFLEMLQSLLHADAVELILLERDRVTVHAADGRRSFVVADGDPRPLDAYASATGPEPQITLIRGHESVRGVIAVHRPAPLDDRDRSLLEDLAAQVGARLRTRRIVAEGLAQSHLAEILGRTSDGIFTITAAGDIASWNPAIERMTGRRRFDVLGKRAADVFPEVGRALDGVVASEADDPGDVVVERPDGSVGWLRLRSCRIADDVESGQRLVVAHDVTAEQQAEHLKRDFVTLVSHELRSPLTPLKGFLRAFVDGLVDDEPEARQEYYGIMLRQAERLERLIGDLLDASQIESGCLLVDVQQVEVGRLIRRQVRDLESEYPDRISFRGPSAPLVVEADAGRVEQVLANLVSNALKYSPAGSPVEVRVESRGDVASIAVTDRGPGVAEADRRRVFERFYRVESVARSKTKGVGLGLFIARSLVRAMGGELTLQSTLGEGSTFEFTLPLAATEPDVSTVVRSLAGATAVG
jgi:PAS domain S-box-containing protein